MYTRCTQGVYYDAVSHIASSTYGDVSPYDLLPNDRAARGGGGEGKDLRLEHLKQVSNL